MEIEVSVGGWEHMCCGRSIALGDDVVWDVWLDEGVYRETHHEPEPGRESIAGRVTAIAARFDDGRSVPIVRVPSGRALRGFADADALGDSAELVEPDTGTVLTEVAGGFRVRVLVADGSALPL